jgi:hypothetical protein
MEQREEAERDVMKELEIKTLDAKTEMQIADALDEIRTRNAHNERTAKEGAEVTMVDKIDNERERQAAKMLKQQVWLSWQAEETDTASKSTTATSSTSVSMDPPPLPALPADQRKRRTLAQHWVSRRNYSSEARRICQLLTDPAPDLTDPSLCSLVRFW